MSSKVLMPEESRHAAPVPWRQVSLHAGGAGSPNQMTEVSRQLSEMEQRCELRLRESHAAGLREGEAAGRAHAAAEMHAVVERLARSLDELAHLRPKLRHDAEADTVRLSLAIARRVLRRELAVDPEAMRGLVLAALEKLQAQEICRARVHPALAAITTECLRGLASGANIEVVSDGSREPGTVVFETERGNLDASVDSQLQEIERGLTDRLRRQR